MNYSELKKLYEKVSATPKRLEKIKTLSEFLKNLKEDELETIYLLFGRIYPLYREEKLGINDKLIIKVISKAFGAETSLVISEWKKIGDLGKVAESFSKKNQQSIFEKKTLTVEKVLNSLRKLPLIEGSGATEKKFSIIINLLVSASPSEARYIIRTILGELRIGMQEGTVRDSLAEAFFSSNKKEAVEEIQNVMNKMNDFAFVLKLAKKKKLIELKKVGLKVGRPIKAMLSEKVRNLKEGFEKVGRPCALEYKYDGFRVFIHKKGKEVLLFTRSLENVTKQFPEITNAVLENIEGKSFILDSEVVGYNKETKKYTNFQAISQRIRRKYDIKKTMKELPVEVNIFDIIFYNGDSIIEWPFEKRSKLVRKIINETPYKIISSKQIITGEESVAEEFYKKALRNGQEGVMMKNLKTPYRAGKRVGDMVKLKPEVKDLDLTITEAEYGNGKRGKWLSSFTLACIDKRNGKFLKVGKVGTGIKELIGEGVSFEQLTSLLEPLILKEEGKKVFLKPKIVIAITYQEIQKSPSYDSGWALRFPRVVAFRPDKPLSEITSLEEINENFENQKRNYRFG